MDIPYKDFLLDIVVNNTDLGIAMVDKEGYFIYYNNVMEEIESLSKDEVIGKHMFKVFPCFNMKNSTLYRCLCTGIPIYNELQSYINGKGRKIFATVTNIPIKIDNEIAGVIEITKDVNREEKTFKALNNWLNEPKIQTSISNDKNKTSYYNFKDFITQDEDIIKLIKNVKKMAKYESNVLIYGETGTGKEIFAQSIHNISSRSEKPFIAQNCAAIPENLLESILFGTEKGSFTGATDKKGLFEQANGGTLLLDELNSLPIFLQAKLLRVLQENYIRRVGGNKDIRIDVRVIATVNEDPSELIKTEKLRKDLYYRLNVLYIHISPLRKRNKDILLLIEEYTKIFSLKFNLKSVKFTAETLNMLKNYEWNGNVRELINVVEYILISIEGQELVEPKHIPHYLVNKLENENIDKVYEEKSKDNSYHDIVDNFEKKIIKEELIKSSWNITTTAKNLNIKRQTLQNKIKRLEINQK